MRGEIGVLGRAGNVSTTLNNSAPSNFAQESKTEKIFYGEEGQVEYLFLKKSENEGKLNTT